MASIVQLITLVALSAMAVIGTSIPACSDSAYNERLFTDSVPWSCTQPMDCFMEFCSCVGGGSELSSACTPFGEVDVATIESCTTRRVTCTLSAALSSHNVWNTSCQQWGDNLASLYATAYANRSFTNLTDACLADTCDLVTAGNAALASSVNYTAICDFDFATLGAPLDRDDVAGCPASERIYFDDIPVAQCSGAANCSRGYCDCLGGSWKEVALECIMPAAQPTGDALSACISSAVSCLTVAALDVYTPGASPLNVDPCQQWAVPIAQDYAMYYNATLPNATLTRESTLLWKACNYTACKDVYRFNHTVDFSSACSFSAVNRTPNFVMYNPCPYSCPDATCAANLANCACTATAAVSDLVTSANYDVSSVISTTSSLVLSASATYEVPAGLNCSNFTFATSLRFSWKLLNCTKDVVQTSSSSTLSIGTLAAGKYTAIVTATGLLAAQNKTKKVKFTVAAPTPIVSVSGPSQTSSLYASTLTASVANPAAGVTLFAWSCTSDNESISCPSVANGTATSLPLFVGSPAGTFTFTYVYTYNGEETASGFHDITIVNDDIPVVNVNSKIGGSVSSTSNVNAFVSTQTFSVSSTVKFSGAFTRSWSINGVTVNGTSDTLSVAANSNSLQRTSLTAAKNGEYVLNTITLTATSNANALRTGNSTVTVVVLETIASTLNVTKQGSLETFAAALIDTLNFATSTTPSLTAATAPFGASLTTTIGYYSVLNNIESGPFEIQAPGGAAKAPLFANSSVEWSSVKFTVRVNLGDAVVTSANASFNITKGDINAAAASVLASTDSITDPNAAVDAISSIGALSEQSSNATLVAQIVSAGLTMLANTITNTTQLSATQSLSVVVNVGALLNKSSSKANASAQVFVVFVAVLSSTSFNLDVAGAVGGAIGQMDSKSGGELALKMVLLVSSKVPVGQQQSIDMGSAGSMTAASSTGAALASLQVFSASGAGVSLPSTFLSEVSGLSEDAVYGVATVVLLISPYEANGSTPTGGIVTQDITADGVSIAVSGLSNPIIITMALGTIGECRFFDTSSSTWSSTGLVTVFNGAVMECHSTHLTAFGGVSSAATAAVSLLVVVLVAFVQMVLA